ncbi:hypothetical protein [uncultured Tateyamaria sp.]|uniref:hypothetical protein n=1 Tax=uncultured Tateyamaria sp. TaxID=455651 RepID=UPI002604E672|nr:hypothetical protein [uncultured Tateyamaria sp.]
MISYYTEWAALSARILGLSKTANTFAQNFQRGSQQSESVAESLNTQCRGILTEVRKFNHRHRANLPGAACEAIDRFVCDSDQLISSTSTSGQLVLAALLQLVAFETEMTFCLSDKSERIRTNSELAFSHLQRLIVADRDYMAKWIDAHKDHETACEKLGAVHLLWHGIWAFKTNAEGGRTDLVFEEPMDLNDHQSALGIVLTEWKRATLNLSIERAFEQAKKQADKYSTGTLAGVELASHRYLVVVAKEGENPKSDFEEGGVIYRHILIQTHPKTPSGGKSTQSTKKIMEFASRR